MRPPPTTRIQLEAQDRVTGSFSNGRVPYTGLDTTAWQACERLWQYRPGSVSHTGLDTTFLRARAACFPRFRRPIVGTKAVIQNSHPVGGKQQATFAGYFDRLDSFIEAIRHARTSITSLYKPSTFHLIEAVRRRASSNYNASRYTTGLAPRQWLEEGAEPRVGTTTVTRGAVWTTITTRGRGRPQHANYARTTRTVRRRPRITTRVVTPRGWTPQHTPQEQRVLSGGVLELRHESLHHGVATTIRLEEGLRHVDHHGIKTQLVTVVAGRPRVATR
jgi:hypothetical protein